MFRSFCSIFVACVAEKKAKGIKASTSREESFKSKGKSAAKSAGRKGKSGGGASNVVEEEEGKESSDYPPEQLQLSWGKNG